MKQKNALFEIFGNLLDPADMLRGGGDLALLGGKPVLWAGPYYGWQSPESFYASVGPGQFEALTSAKSPSEIYARAATMPGYKPEAPRLTGADRPFQGADLTRSPAQQQADAQAATAQAATPPPAAPTLPDPGQLPAPTIPQGTDAGYKELVDILKAQTDPARVKELESFRAQKLLEQSLLTSALSGRREAARYGRDIEKENIQAWRNIEQEKIRANAIAQASIGVAMVSAFAPPNAQALSSTLQAAMAPYSSMKFS